MKPFSHSLVIALLAMKNHCKAWPSLEKMCSGPVGCRPFETNAAKTYVGTGINATVVCDHVTCLDQQPRNEDRIA
jgi:hypothetical protein